jgi:hypothetical protein
MYSEVTISTSPESSFAMRAGLGLSSSSPALSVGFICGMTVGAICGALLLGFAVTSIARRFVGSNEQGEEAPTRDCSDATSIIEGYSAPDIPLSQVSGQSVLQPSPSLLDNKTGLWNFRGFAARGEDHCIRDPMYGDNCEGDLSNKDGFGYYEDQLSSISGRITTSISDRCRDAEDENEIEPADRELSSPWFDISI